MLLLLEDHLGNGVCVNAFMCLLFCLLNDSRGTAAY